MSAETPTAPETVEAQAKQFLANPNFCKSFTIPKTEDHEELTISYADFGRQPKNDEDAVNIPTILFHPGMFATRLALVLKHTMAEKLGVRIITADRPGMGSSTDIDVEKRIDIWIEIVPKLLEHLHIKHVSLASHSAGTLYLLNTLVRLRHILDPKQPLVALFAPWVDPTYSKLATMQVLKYIPAGAYSIWNKIPKFFMVDAAPAFEASGSVMSSFTKMLPTSLQSSGGDSDNAVMAATRQKLYEEYGLPQDLLLAINTKSTEAVFAESTVGANREALLCTRKGPEGSWGRCDNYDTYVKELAAMEKDNNTSDGAGKLRVRLYFAKSDLMIGETGREYMEGCWQREASAFDFKTAIVEDTDHDSVLSGEVFEQLFIDVGGKRP